MLAFTPIVVRRELNTPGRRLSSKFSRLFDQTSVVTLCRVGAYCECCEFAANSGLGVLSTYANEFWIRSLFELGKFNDARQAVEVLSSQPLLETRPQLAELKAHLHLIMREEAKAIDNLKILVRDMPHFLCPHQNLAARYAAEYSPTRLDYLCGDDGRLFDAYNYVGQRVTHVGEGQLGAALYGAAFEAQERLRAAPPQLSPELTVLLRELDIDFEDLRILPVEWYTQIGHQGMLDVLFRMRALNWWHGKVIFLMPHEIVANHAFQRLFESYGHVLVPGANVTVDVARELCSLQRWCGMGFNAFSLLSGEIVPWQEAGAKAMIQWELAELGYPLREEFDRVYGSNEAIAALVRQLRYRWGMKPKDWYVCLHMRDASHYAELSGTGQTHRNADLESYLRTIEFITESGGWVVKLGGPRSPKLPKMERVIDYARGSVKSELLDVHLIRYARYFIGTTSGLTNVAVSLGTPCALVNCITTDAQLWSSRVRFALKRIRLRDGTFLNQHQLTSTPWRWRVFGADVLARHGAVLIENTPDEILETAKEVDALGRERSEDYRSAFPEAEELLALWRASLKLPHFYGNAEPSLYYLKKHSEFVQKVETSDSFGVNAEARSPTPILSGQAP